MPDASDESEIKVPPWLWPNVFGLDAALVAVAWQHLFATAFRIKIPGHHYAVLGLVVLVIYSADRLLDALRLGNPAAAAPRHRFYRRHFRVMTALTALAGAAAIFLVLTKLPANVVNSGLALSLLVVLYFVHRIWVEGPILALLPKEVFSGFVFAAGATLIGFAAVLEVPSGMWSEEVLCFGTLCAVNCLAISVWEREHDAGNDRNSIAQLWPGAVRVFPGFAVAVAVAGLVFAFVNRHEVGFPLMLASATGLVLLALLANVAGQLKPAALRVLADAAVILPALAFLPMLPWDSTG